MRERMGGLCLLAASLFLPGVRSASAQDSVVMSANYDIVYHELEETSVVGVHLDAAKRFGMISGVGEIGFNHFDDATVISVSGGGRYMLTHSSGSRIEPAVQVLLGLWHCGACDVSEIFLQPGFLVDIPRSPTFKIRAAFDVRRIFFEFGGENAERVSIGGVWTF